MVSILFCSLCLWCSSLPAQEHMRAADKTRRDGVIDTICGLLERKYVFPDRAKTFADELRRRKNAGAYDSFPDAGQFAEAITSDLQASTNDKHMRLRLREPGDTAGHAEGALHHPMRLYRLRNKEHCGFYKLEWMEGNIGYIDIKRFYPPAEAGDIVQGIMKALSGASAIIIDLRDNQGGESDLGMLMCSYFFARPTQLTGTYFRDGHLLQESWTRRTIRGERLADVPLFLLTSDRTFVSHQIAGDGQRGGKIHLLFRKVPIAGFLPGRPGEVQGAAFVDFCHPVG